MSGSSEAARLRRSFPARPHRRSGCCLHHRGGRAAHLVDLENLVGDPKELGYASMADVPNSVFVQTTQVYRTNFIGANDLVWAAADVGRFPHLAWLWSGYSFLDGHGRNGADHALLNRFDPDASSRTCGTLHIASGDAVFADAARRFRSKGGRVVVHGRRGCVAWELYRHSDEVIMFDDLMTTEMVWAS